MSADKMKVQVLILFISNYKHEKADTFKRWVTKSILVEKQNSQLYSNSLWQVDWTYFPDYWYVMRTLYTKYEMD